MNLYISIYTTINHLIVSILVNFINSSFIFELTTKEKENKKN